VSGVEKTEPVFDPSPLLEALQVEVSTESLAQALTHSSFAYENGGADNERLEFLGDAVLGQAITAALYRRFPDLPEGELAKRRASIVSTTALADIARSISLGDFLRLGKGEELTGGRDKPSLLADALEALFGVVFLEKGSSVATELVERLLKDFLDDADRRSESSDPKTTLQEWGARTGMGIPRYNISDQGPDHAKVFTADVYLNGFPGGSEPAGHGTGSSKKAAELAAARAALDAIAAANLGDA
jgi:ribonuclease III